MLVHMSVKKVVRCLRLIRLFVFCHASVYVAPIGVAAPLHVHHEFSTVIALATISLVHRGSCALA